MDDFPHILRVLLDVLVCFLLLFTGELRVAPTAFTIVEPGKMLSFPRIEPMIDGETTNSKDVHQISSGSPLKTEEKTMRTLSNAMVLTLFIASPE